MAEALTLAYVAPLITTALSPFFLDEKVGIRRWSAVIVPIVWVNPTFNQWSLLALMGIFACLGHFFLILSLRYADASKLAPFGYFEIVTNVILGYYFFSDFPDFFTWLGLLVIVCSGIYISFRERLH